MSAHFERAMVLFEQSRYDLAEKELRQALADEPDDPTIHAFLALCLSHREAYRDATEEAHEAIRLGPDSPFAHYALASVLHDRDHLPEAEAAIDEAIRLDPEEPDYYSLLAGIRFEQRRWSGALAAAEEGLRLDAEHVGCNNMRAMALVKLGRKEEAGATLEAALAKDPENDATHANQGWALLEQGEPVKAMEHFREALRLNPDSEWARQGILEALKAHHFIYRMMLRYFFWMSKFSQGGQWAIIVGGYIGYRVLLSAAAKTPGLEPWVVPIRVIYLSFVLLTWTADPLFNLLLRLNRFGRLVLFRDEVVASNWIGGCVGLALLSLGGWLLTQSMEALFTAGFFGLMIIPTAGTFKCEKGWPRNVMASYTIGMAIMGMAALALLYLGSPFFVLPGALFLLATFLSSWVANALLMVRPRR